MHICADAASPCHEEQCRPTVPVIPTEAAILAKLEPTLVMPVIGVSCVLRVPLGESAIGVIREKTPKVVVGQLGPPLPAP